MRRSPATPARCAWVRPAPTRRRSAQPGAPAEGPSPSGLVDELFSTLVARAPRAAHDDQGLVANAAAARGGTRSGRLASAPARHRPGGRPSPSAGRQPAGAGAGRRRARRAQDRADRRRHADSARRRGRHAHGLAAGDLRVRASGDLPQPYVDPVRIEQVIRNLVDNAVKFSPPTGTDRHHRRRPARRDRGDGEGRGAGRGAGVSRARLRAVLPRRAGQQRRRRGRTRPGDLQAIRRAARRANRARFATRPAAQRSGSRCRWPRPQRRVSLADDEPTDLRPGRRRRAARAALRAG